MARLWVIATVAARFHQLPSVVARDLDSDPERLSLACLPLLAYAEAKAAFDNARSRQDLAGWARNSMMQEVERNAFALAREDLGMGEN